MGGEPPPVPGGTRSKIWLATGVQAARSTPGRPPSTPPPTLPHPTVFICFHCSWKAASFASLASFRICSSRAGDDSWQQGGDN